MFGRRSHPRFGVLPPVHGSVRVLRDVIVRSATGSELVAVSHESAGPGEMMRLDVEEPGGGRSMEVEVVESRPIVLDGAVRHQLRLRVRGESAK